jgi:hypothetical protein
MKPRGAHVLSASTRAAIERMAEEFAHDMLAEPVLRERLRNEATAAARQLGASLTPRDVEA